MAFVYCIVNTTNGKCYVGKTVTNLRRRWWGHVKSANAGSTNYIHNAIRKHGKDAFDILSLEECDDSDLSSLEMMWIRLLATNKIGYNLTEGGDGILGFHHSDETRRKISEAAKQRKTNSMQGRKHSAESIVRMKLSQIGKKHSEATRQKMRESHKNRKPISEETRKKLSESHKCHVNNL